MTEGIIQRVFTDYEPLSPLLKQIQGELIEEIKRYNFDTDKYFDDMIKQALIGDNE